MSNRDFQENIDDETTVSDKVAEKPIGDGLFITIIAATTVGMFSGLRAIGVGQHDALLISTSLVWLFSLPLWER